MTGVFGPIVGSYDVEQAALAVLEEWLPTYLARVAEERGVDPSEIPRPRSVFQTKEFEGWPEDRLPCVQVVSPGQAQPPQGDEGGMRAWWQMNIFCVVKGRDRAATRMLRSIYEDAIPWCLMQHQGLGGIAAGLKWLGAGAGDVTIVDQRDERTLQGAVNVFTVEVERILDPIAGPAAPDPLPPVDGSNPRTLDGLPAYPDDPDAETVDVTVTPLP